MKILQLSTYPTIEPRHGGQIRASHISRFLSLRGHEVHSYALCEPTFQHYTSDDVILSKKELAHLPYQPIAYDYATSILCLKEPYFSYLKEKILNLSPEVIILEQVWLYPLYKALYGEHTHKPFLIYSSHNVEYKMKKELFEFLNISDVDLLQAIEKLEKELCNNADYVISCTSADKEELIKIGAKDVIVCANGAEKIRKQTHINHYIKRLLSFRSFAFFVSSAHAPNAIGFWEMLSSNLFYLKPHQIIVVAGSVSYILKQYAPKSTYISRLVNEEKLKLLGEVSQEVLAALLECASVILLPITIGGGSNLKSAEAIVANKPTVATKTAIRGFEFAQNLTHFNIVQTQQEFIQALQQSFMLKQPLLSQEERKIRDSLYWGFTLSPLDALMETISNKIQKN